MAGQETAPWDEQPQETAPWEEDQRPEQKQPDLGPMKKYISGNLKNWQAAQNVPKGDPNAQQNTDLPGAAPIPGAAPAENPPGQKGPQAANSFLDAVEAGFQMSVTGLVKRGKLPETILPEDAPMAYRLASQAATLAGDVPAMLAGGIGGALAGGGLGTAELPVIGTVAGAGVGASAGAWALPAALRTALMQHYKKGDIKSFGDFWERSGGVFMDALKAGTVGAVTGGAGAAAENVLGQTAAPALLQTAGKLGSELATMTTVGKAMDGQVPKAQDFIDGALLLTAFHGASSLSGELAPHVETAAGKLRDIYAKTGLTPDQVALQAQTNPVLHQEILSSNKEIPSAYESAVEKPGPGSEAIAPPDPAKVEVGSNKQLNELAGPLNKDISEPSKVVAEAPAQEEPPAKPEEEQAPARADAEKQVLDRIVPSEKQKTPLSFDKAYTAMVDDLHPLKVMTEQLSGENPPPVSKNPYNLMRLSRGAYGKADQFLEHGPFSFDSLKQTGTQGLKEILEPFKDDLDGFRAYAVASRTVELNARGIETGVPLEAAKETAKAGREKYEGAFQELGKFQNETLAYLRDSGLLSKDAYQKMEEANRSYVPFFRLQEKGEQIKGAGQGLQVKNPIKGIEGSGSQIIDPIESIVKNTYMYVTLAERNRALSALADLAEKNPEAGLMTRIPTPQKPIEVQKEELSKFMAAHGLPPTDDSMTIFRPQSLPLAQDEIALYRDGKREVYQVPQAVADTVKGLDRESSNMLTRWAALPAKLIRVGAVHTPDFLGRHLIRDQFNAFTLSKNGYVPFLDALSGLGSLLKQDDDYQSFLKSGGAISSAVSIDRDYIQSEVFKLSKETGLMDMARNVVKSPLAALQVAAELMSNSTRIGEFKRAAGGETDPDSIMRAGLASRDVTLDYQRIGAQTRALNSIVAFWNAHLQGMDRMMRAFQEDPAGMTLKVGASITLPSVLLWYANHDDPRYQELPRWQKDLFWIVMTKDHIFRIPKPFEPGVLFGSLPERVLEQFHDKNPSAWKGFGDSVTQGAIPNYMPTFALPALEQWANKSYMTGGSIIPGDLEKVLPEYQYNNYTTETGKMLGKMVGALPAIGQMGPEGAKLESPMVVENYIRAWGGGLGRYALQLSDLALTKSGLVPEAPKPASTLSDMPFIKAFTVRYPSAQAQSIQDFHEAYNETQRVIDTVKHLSKTGDFKSVEKMLAVEQNQDSLLNLSETQKAISTQNQMVQNIYRNPDMKPDEKRQLIDTLYYQMIQSARGGLEKVKEFQKAISSRQ